MSRIIEWLIDTDNAPPLGHRRVITQAFHDLFGTKDVQDAATATHSWMAGQVGHAALGAAPTLLLCWHWATGPTGYLASFGIVFGFFLLKELWDYKSATARQGAIFKFKADEVGWNVLTALFYISLGAVWVVFLLITDWWRVAVFLALCVIALRIAFWWLRRKLAFQQAGLPYQFRLASFKTRLDADEKFSADKADKVCRLANVRGKPTPLLKFLFCRDLPHEEQVQHRHLIIFGQLGSGKTPLAVGIGTESAFSLHFARYLSAVQLLQWLDEHPHPDLDKMTMEFEGGRSLWPLQGCDLVIIDDVIEPAPSLNAQQRGQAEAAGDAWINVIQPGNFPDAVGNRLAWLGPRRSVWVVGDPRADEDWKTCIKTVLGVAEEHIMTVYLQGRPRVAAH
jgi:hypothetical protein